MRCLAFVGADLLGSSSLDLPNNLVSMWMPVIKLLGRLQLTNVLLDGLVMRLTDEIVTAERDVRTLLVNRLTAGWIKTVISRLAGER